VRRPFLVARGFAKAPSHPAGQSLLLIRPASFEIRAARRSRPRNFSKKSAQAASTSKTDLSLKKIVRLERLECNPSSFWGSFLLVEIGVDS